MTSSSSTPRASKPRTEAQRPSLLAQIKVQLETPPEYRGTEIIGDLRGIAETLFYPFKFVGFWDGQTGNHLCPMKEAGKDCPHGTDDGAKSSYATTIEDELAGELAVEFPHADLTLYLG